MVKSQCRTLQLLEANTKRDFSELHATLQKMFGNRAAANRAAFMKDVTRAEFKTSEAMVEAATEKVTLPEEAQIHRGSRKQANFDHVFAIQVPTPL